MWEKEQFSKENCNLFFTRVRKAVYLFDNVFHNLSFDSVLKQTKSNINEFQNYSLRSEPSVVVLLDEKIVGFIAIDYCIQFP